MMLTPPSRPETCLSDLTFERLFASELSADAVSEHLASCQRCRERHAELSQLREVFLRRRPEPAVHKQHVMALRWVGSGAALLLAAAACAVLWRPPIEEQGVRVKGAPHIGFFVTRAGHSTRATPDYKVRPGEQIRFVYSSSRPAYLAIYAVDAEQQVSVYFPQGERAHEITAGADVVLPSGVELDHVLGREHIYALFCGAEFAVEAFRAQLARAELTEAVPEDCQLEALSWVKEAAP